MRLCISKRRSVRPSVCPSLRLSIRPSIPPSVTGFPKILKNAFLTANIDRMKWEYHEFFHTHAHTRAHKHVAKINEIAELR